MFVFINSWPACTTTLEENQMPPALTSTLQICCCIMSEFRIDRVHLCWLKAKNDLITEQFEWVTVCFSLQLLAGATGQLQVLFWTAGRCRLLRLLLCPQLQSDYSVCQRQELSGESMNNNQQHESSSCQYCYLFWSCVCISHTFCQCCVCVCMTKWAAPARL